MGDAGWRSGQESARARRRCPFDGPGDAIRSGGPRRPALPEDGPGRGGDGLDDGRCLHVRALPAFLGGHGDDAGHERSRALGSGDPQHLTDLTADPATPVTAPDMPPITVIAVAATGPAKRYAAETTTTPATVPIAAIPATRAERTADDSTPSSWPQQTRRRLVVFLQPFVTLPP